MKVIIVDDERLARKELIRLLGHFPTIEVIAECSNADEAIDKIEQLRPQLIFLDIQMPGKDGFSLLAQLDYIPHVIFVSAYDEYAVKAFEVNALDYLLKPVQMERLEEAINKLNNEEEEEVISHDKLGLKDQVFVKDGDKCWFIKLEDIPLFESEGNYVRVYFNNNKPLILKSLNNLAEKLDESIFFRANRKFIVNLTWIEKIENWFNGRLMVKLKNGQQVEISRRQTIKLKELKSL